MSHISEIQISGQSLSNRLKIEPFKRQPHKMSNTQTIRRLFAGELCESIWSCCEVGAQRVNCLMESSILFLDDTHYWNTNLNFLCGRTCFHYCCHLTLNQPWFFLNCRY